MYDIISFTRIEKNVFVKISLYIGMLRNSRRILNGVFKTLQLISYYTLLNEIIAIRNNVFLPTRYKFIHSVSTEFYKTGGDKFIKGILDNGIISEARCCQVA